MHPSHRDVAFLLSLGALPVACNDKDPGTTTPGTTATTSGSGDTEPPDPGTGDTGDTGDTGGTEGATASTGGEPTPTSSSPTEGPTSLTGDTDAHDPLCEEYIGHIAECFPQYNDPAYTEMLIVGCTYTLEYGEAIDGPDCRAALEARYVCYRDTPCADFPKGDADPPICEAEEMAFSAACPSIEGGSESSSTT